MSPTPDCTLDDPAQIIADLKRQLAESNAERDEAQAQQAATAEVLQETLEFQSATSSILRVINQAGMGLEYVLGTLVETAARLCRADNAIIFRLRDGKYHIAASVGFSSEFMEHHARSPTRIGRGTITGRTAIERRAIHIEDAAADPEYTATRSQQLGQTRTMLGVPLFRDDAVTGVITLSRSRVERFSEKQIALVTTFADQAVIAMENARLITETREALEHQTATAEVLGIINSSPGHLAPVFDALLDKALRLCEAIYGMLITWDGERLHRSAFRGASVELMEALGHEQSMPQPGGVADRLLRGEDIIYTADITQDPSFARAPRVQTLARVGGARSYIAVPLRKDDRLLGFIGMYRREVRPFSEKEIALLQNFAAQAVIAMENARLITETREALEQQTATAEVLQVINSSPGDLAPVFDAMLDKAIRLCEAAHGHLLSYDGECFHPAADSGEPHYVEWVRQVDAARPAPSAPLGRISLGERIVHIADLREEEVYRTFPGFREQADIRGARSQITVGLLKDNTLLGAMILYRQEVRPFTDKQIALLQNFAAQAVIAIENARLITETREALEQQTATAEVLQVINSSPGDLAPVFDAILEKSHTLCGAAHGALHIYDGEFFRPAAMRGLPEPFAERLRQGFRASGNPLAEALLAGERFVHISDLAATHATHPGLRVAIELAGTRTLLSVPLRKDGVLLGLIVAFRQEVRPFTDKQIALLQNFAAQAVIAIENARLITETREALDQQTATAEVLQVINSSPGDLVPVFNAILEKAHNLCGVASGALQLYDGEKFRAVATNGLPEPLAEWLRDGWPPGSSQQRVVAGEADVIHIADLAASDSPRARYVAEIGGVRTLLYVALRKDQKLLGVISASRFEVRPFSEKEIALLQNFAAQAVIAMENARLLGELRQRTDEVGELNRDLEARVAEQVDELGRVGRLKRFLAPQLAELIVSQGDEKILESHRREIVVVFCDLRGYTAFTETAEPEEVLDFLRQYHGALGPLVSQFEGTLDQFSGDGIMVFFNDPVPCPDPAERAVKMAIAMRSAANTLIAEWRERGRDLGFGAGIAQGYATLGQIGFSERSGYTAIGTVCNVAARLCAEAKDGQILLGQRVNVALKGSVATEQLGPLTLKGLSQPVVAYNVLIAAIQPALRVIEGGSPETV